MDVTNYNQGHSSPYFLVHLQYVLALPQTSLVALPPLPYLQHKSFLILLSDIDIQNRISKHEINETSNKKLAR